MTERVKMRNIQRMWINCPSTLQIDHKDHGRNVLVDLDDKTFEHSYRVFFLDGEVESVQVDKLSLSAGWNQG